MSLSRILPAAALTLTAASAHADTFSRPGWVEATYSSSSSAGKNMAGEDYRVGYDAWAKFGAANWDVAADSFTQNCSYFLCSSHLLATSSSLDLMTGKTIFDVPDAGKEARMRAELTVPVTLMDESIDLFRVEASARGASFGPSILSSVVWFAGSIVMINSIPLPWSAPLTMQCGEIFDVDADFEIGGIPVTAGMSAEGCVYVEASVTWTNNVLAGSITPGSSVDATLSAGVGTSGYSAGVYGTVTLFDASMPFSFANRVTATGGTVEGNVCTTITGLDGEFGLYVDLFGETIATQELFDWTGIKYVNKTIVTLPIASSP